MMKEARGNHEVSQEFIVNGLLVTINNQDKVYFERIEDYQVFYGFWVRDRDLTIEECLRLTQKETTKKISLEP